MSGSYPTVVGEDGSNRAWRSYMRALAEDWSLGEIEDQMVFEDMLMTATPATARECLDILPEAARAKFDLWFTMRYGTEIPKREYLITIGYDYGARYKPDVRVIEAYHRIVLDRREPL